MIAPRSRGGRWVIVPDGHSAARARALARQRRRRRFRILSALVVVAIGTGVWAMLGSMVALSLNLVADAGVIVYGAATYEASRRAKEQLRKVRALTRHPLSVSRTPWPEVDEEPVAL